MVAAELGAGAVGASGREGPASAGVGMVSHRNSFRRQPGVAVHDLHFSPAGGWLRCAIPAPYGCMVDYSRPLAALLPPLAGGLAELARICAATTSPPGVVLRLWGLTWSRDEACCHSFITGGAGQVRPPAPSCRSCMVFARRCPTPASRHRLEGRALEAARRSRTGHWGRENDSPFDAPVRPPGVAPPG